MRIAILSNTLPAALTIYEELSRNSDRELFVILCPSSDNSNRCDFSRHFARWILKGRRWKSLRLALAGHVFICRRPLDHPQTLARLAELRFDVGLHKTGTIYREATINLFRLGILNAHIGLLPKYRGRSVMEWSLVQGDPVGISGFFVDEGIDTGKRVVLSETINISHCRSLTAAKGYLFNLDAQIYRRAIERLNTGDVTYQENDGSGRRYYVMSKLFQDVAESCLAIRNPKSEIGYK